MRPEARALLESARVARLATTSAQGTPHVVPVVFVADGDRLYVPLDAKKKRVEALELRRVKNIMAVPQAALLVDEYDEDWSKLRYLLIRGRAQLLSAGGDPRVARVHDLLREKYPPYRHTDPGTALIEIQPRRIIYWQNDGGFGRSGARR